MALQYILDGYNIIKRLPQRFHGSLRAGRDALVRFLLAERPQGSSRNGVIVVFDGKSAVTSPEVSVAGVRVLFSRDESADELIKRLIDTAAHPQRCVVVTDDRELGYYVRGAGARTVPVAEFCRKSARRRISAQTGTTTERSDKPGLDARQSQRITEELTRFWVKKNNRSRN